MSVLNEVVLRVQFNFYSMSGRPTIDATISIYCATGHLRVGSAAEYFIFENHKIM
jgi:hypothetical protein